MDERGQGRRTSSRGGEKSARLDFLVPVWLKQAVVVAAEKLGVTPSDIARIILAEPIVTLEGKMPPHLAIMVAFMDRQAAINRKRAEKAQMTWESGAEDIPSDAVESIGVKPKGD